MKLYMVVIRDIQANVFGQPMFVATVGGAIRSFGDEINRADEKNVMYHHPEDFELYELGWYGDGDAAFSLNKDGPKQIATGKQFATAR